MTSKQLRVKRRAEIATYPKVQELDGIRFVRDDERGYYRGYERNAKKPTLMHRYVYERYFGKIPKGYHVHHKNGLKWDNTKDNLELIDKRSHASMHGKNPSQDISVFRKENMDKQRPLTKAWHVSKEGRVWHKKHAVECKKNGWSREIVEITCRECGLKVQRLKGTKFCCPAHKAKWRREQGIDDIDRICPECHKTFRISKYSDQQYCCRECGSIAAGRARRGKITRRKVPISKICKKCGEEFATDACNQKYCCKCAKLYPHHPI